MTIAEHAVVIAGAGPTGMMLAGELSLAGVDVVVFDERESPQLESSRSGGLHARTIEVLDQRGIAERFLAEGTPAQVIRFHASVLDISDFPTRHNYGLALWQKHFERILAGWLDELAAPIRRGIGVAGFVQDDEGVDVVLSDGGRMRARYLVGCDGGRSLIRKAASIGFPGWDPTTSWLIAEVEMTEPELGVRNDALGTHGMTRLEDGPVRVVLTEASIGTGEQPTLSELSTALIAVYGTDFGARDPRWISRFTDMSRQAASYRERRIVLAGDAAHVHPPVGGQGLNIGVQDAVNLGWKLAQVVKGTSPDGLLDTYHAERHPVAARVIANTMAQMAIRRPDDRFNALGDYVTEFLAMDGPRKHIAGEMSGLGLHYDIGDGHPLLGRRVPDLDILTDHGPTRIFALLHEARPVLLNLGEAIDVDVTAWADRVRVADATYTGAWELPVVGPVPAPTAVLIRPDGYVCWVGEGTQDGLRDALSTWFGPPA